jgi:hypothetical protein
MRKIPLVLGLLIASWCASALRGNLISGSDWSFRTPDKNRWFIRRAPTGYATTLVGGSTYNVGARPVGIIVSESCEKLEDVAGAPIGTGNKYMGARRGELFAYRTSDHDVIYRASIDRNSCKWTFRCTGDDRNIERVREICTSMIDTLEFSR